MTPTADPQAMFDLANLYREQRAYVRACLVSCRVPEAALDDALQDVFVVLFRRLDDFDAARGTLRAWLFGISFRVARTHRRRAGRPALCADALEADDAVADPERYVSRLRAAELAAEMLDTLPRDQLSVLVLADIEGLRGPEIGDALQLPLGTVHSRLARARKRLAAERTRRFDQGMESRPWFAVLAANLRDRFGARPELAAAAFVSVQALRTMLAVAGVALLALALFWLQRDTAGEDATTATKPASVLAAAADQGLAAATGTTSRSGDATVALTTSSISGTVTDAAAHPLAGADACIWLEVDALITTETRLPRCTKTNARGQYEVRGLMPARYRVTASAAHKRPGQFDTGSPVSFFALHRDEHKTGIDLTLADGGVRLEGVVSDVTGGPVSGAIVMARDPSHSSPITDGTWGATAPVMARSDDEGGFALWVEPGSLNLLASAEGYAGAKTLVVAPGLSARLVMSPESVLAGRVVDRTSGEPVAGARISVGGEGPARRGATSALSDENGRFRITGLEPGRYRPVATAPGRMGDADASVRVGLGETIDDLTVALISVPSVHGRIVGDDDSPCATGIVALQGRESGQTFAAMSGGGGSIVLQAVLPDTYDVVAACEGSALPGPLLPIIVADRDIVGLQWTTTAGHAIRGRVLDSTGAPVDGAFVSVFAAGPGASPVQMSARSGSDGTFEVAGALPGTYLMGARHRTLGELSKGDVVVADQDIEVELQLPRTRAIRGRVVDESGAAQAGVDVTMRQPYERTVTRDDGTFTLASIPPGQHRVTAQRSIGDVSAATSVELGPDADADIEITLPTRDRTISGRVLDEDGDAVRDAIVSALPDAVMDERGRDYAMRQLRGLSGFGRGRPPILTDAEGRFEISVHDGEAYTVMAQRRGGGDEWKTGVAAGASVTLEIPARASISGRIVTEAGEGATGLTVRLRNTSSGATLQESFLFAGGRFRFDELGAGPYELVAVAKEGRTRADLELDAGAEQTGLAYTLIGGVTVRGQVVDVTNGKPVGGMLVIVGPETDEIDHFATEAERAMVFSKEGHQTDEEGRFEIVDVPPGALRVMVLPLKMGKGPYGRAMFAMATAGLQPVNELQPIPIAPLPGGIDGKVPPPSFTLQASGPWCTDTPVVDTVVPGSGAAAAGLAKGDIIVAVDGHDVKDRRCHLASRLTMTPAGASVDLTLEDGREVTVRAAP